LLLADRQERDRLQGMLSDHGIRLSAVSGSGNPLHPNAGARADAIEKLRGAIELAAALKVDRVVAMSGCPAGRDGGGDVGVFAISSMVLDDEALWQWQFDTHVAPFWREISDWARKLAPDLRICLELHPGAAIFNPATFELLADEVGENIGVNLDPSHFWWQGMDPVAVIEAVGPRIYFAHGKDTTIYEDRMRLNGVLDHRFPVASDKNVWHFSWVGDGHTSEEWTRLLQALQRAGYDDVISIEQEDPSLSPEESLERSLATLRGALEA
jgi:sugar phosphate isomerase/epimerase